MMIYNVTEEILQQALDTTNAKYDGNIRFKHIERKGKTREGGEKWQVTLTVFSTWRKVPREDGGRGMVKVTAPGVRRAVNAWTGKYGKRLAAACWHAHGTFFDALPKYTHTDGTRCDAWPCHYLADRMKVRIVTGRLTTHPGVPWPDFNIGSEMVPTELSIACDCEDVEPPNGIVWKGERNRSVFATVV